MKSRPTALLSNLVVSIGAASASPAVPWLNPRSRSPGRRSSKPSRRRSASQSSMEGHWTTSCSRAQHVRSGRGTKLVGKSCGRRDCRLMALAGFRFKATSSISIPSAAQFRPEVERPVTPRLGRFSWTILHSRVRSCLESSTRWGHGRDLPGLSTTCQSAFPIGRFEGRDAVCARVHLGRSCAHGRFGRQTARTAEALVSYLHGTQHRDVALPRDEILARAGYVAARATNREAVGDIFMNALGMTPSAHSRTTRQGPTTCASAWPNGCVPGPRSKRRSAAWRRPLVATWRSSSPTVRPTRFPSRCGAAHAEAATSPI